MDKKLNNADSTLAGDLQASNTTSMTVKSGEGALYGSTFPIEVTVEQYTGTVVTKRETVTISGRSGDVLTIGSRASQLCVQDDSAATKTRTQNALSFVSGDRVYISYTEKDADDLQTELDAKVSQSAYDQEKNVYGASSEGTDAYKITDASITAYSEKNIYKVKADVANTGACTFEINSLGAKAVKKEQGSTDLANGDWKVSGIATLQYNSTLDVFQFTGQNAVVAVVANENTTSSVSAGENVTAGNAIVHAFIAYESKSLSVTSQDTTPEHIKFKSDGTKAYMLGDNNNTIYQYSLSTAYDINSATYDSVSFSVGTQEGAPDSFHIRNDGSKFYVLGGNDTVYQYSMSTPWDLSTASYDSVSFSGASESTGMIGLTFNSDESKMFLSDTTNDRIYSYTLSTPGLVNTASYDSVSFYVGDVIATPLSIDMTSNTQIVVLSTVDDVIEIELENASDLSTARITRKSGYVGNEDTNPRGITYANGKIYITGGANDTIYQYFYDKYLKGDASDVNRLNFKGYATQTVTAGNNFDLNTDGVNTNQTNIIEGADYFLSDTAGEIDTKAGTHYVKVGDGLNSTSVRIFNQDLISLNMVELSGDQAVGTSLVRIDFDTAVVGKLTANSEMQAAFDGYYDIKGSVYLTNATSGSQYQLSLYVNNASKKFSIDRASASSGYTFEIGARLKLKKGDLVDLRITAGTAATVSSNKSGTYFEMNKIS